LEREMRREIARWAGAALLAAGATGCVPDLVFADGGTDGARAAEASAARPDGGAGDAETCPLHATQCDASVDGNLIENGDFRCGPFNWTIQPTVAGFTPPTLGEGLDAGCGTLCVTFSRGVNASGAFLAQPSFAGVLAPGSSYELRYQASATPAVARIIVEIVDVFEAGDAGAVLVYANVDGGVGETSAEGDFADPKVASFTHAFTVDAGTFTPGCMLLFGIELQGTLGPDAGGEHVCFENVTLQAKGNSEPGGPPGLP
jgi:hypothetical protein